MRKTTKNKTIVATAFLIALMLIAFLVPHFLGNFVDACGRHKPPHHPCPPPLGKTIIKHFVYPDGTPIGAGLNVTIWNTQLIASQLTDATGTVIFSDLPDGTYTFVYSWQGIEYRPSEEIRCTKIVWEFTNEVPYWTLEKTFYYDKTEPSVPISHLNVSLYLDDSFIAWQLTDETGKVSFSDLKAGNYTLEWVWGGEKQNEAVLIDSTTPSPVVLTNSLTPKSGGDK